MCNTYLLPYIALLFFAACKCNDMQGMSFIRFLELTECTKFLFIEILNTTLTRKDFLHQEKQKTSNNKWPGTKRIFRVWLHLH